MGVQIYMGVEALDSIWLEIVGAQNIMGGVFLGLIAVVGLVILCGLLACFCADKCLLKIPYCVCACLVIVVFLGLGAALVGVSIGVQKAIDEICDGDSTAKYNDMITKLYTESDKFYCEVDPGVLMGDTSDDVGCRCKVSDAAVVAALTASGRTTPQDFDAATGTIKNVQECEKELTTLYESSGAKEVFGDNTSDGLSKYKKYLNYLGDIEADYECSGICVKQNFYYFSDINAGIPEVSCKDKIKNEVAGKQIGMFGYGGLAIAIALCLPWLMHFPMYCLPGKGAFCEHSKASLPIINRI